MASKINPFTGELQQISDGSTDTDLTIDGTTLLIDDGVLKTNLLSDDAINIQIDEIRARDIDGLKLNDDAGNGIFIQDGGNVGIGKTPGAKLDVNGDVVISNDFTVATSVIFADISNGTVNIGSAVTGTDRLNVFGGGTATQTGIASFYDSSSNIKFRMRDEWTAMSIPPRLESHSALGFAFNTTTDSKYIWYVNGTSNEKMRLNSTGLGIGTDSPNSKLEVIGKVKIGNVDEVALTTLHILDSSPTIRLSSGGTGNTGGFEISLGSVVDFKGLGNNDYLFSTNNAEKMRITAGGNVGIGETSPGSKLHISGAETTNPLLQITNTEGVFDKDTIVRLTSQTSGGNPFVTFQSNNSFSLGYDRPNSVFALSFGLDVGANHLLAIDTSGNVGIGTTSPNALLDIETTGAGVTTSLRIHNASTTNGSSHAQLELRTETAFGGDPHILFTVGGQGNWIMGTDNGDTDAFKISDSTVLATDTRLKIDFLGSVSCPATTGAFIPNRLTTTQRDALTPVNGMIIYNTTLEKFQGRENGAWANLI